LMFSIVDILLSWRSRTSKFLSVSMGIFIYSIWFLESIKTLKFSETACKLDISLSLFILRSMNVRFGRDTRFSILEISLFYKFRYFIFSSPSNSGTCLRQRESRFIFSMFYSLSLGLLYMIIMFGI
jgi:hypothetical protein